MKTPEKELPHQNMPRSYLRRLFLAQIFGKQRHRNYGRCPILALAVIHMGCGSSPPLRKIFRSKITLHLVYYEEQHPMSR